MSKASSEDTFIVKKRNLKNDYYSFLLGPCRWTSKCRPGSFLHLQIPESKLLLRRAFSIAAIDPENNNLEIIIKAVGRGTHIMGEMRKGDQLNILGPLGVPFKMPERKENVLIAAGGVGFPPLMFLTEQMVAKGHDPKKIEFFYGGRSKADLLEVNRIKKMGVNLHPVTEDGSLGVKGLITQPIEAHLDKHPDPKPVIYSCGPEGMLKAVNALALKRGLKGQLSLEAPMPCGVGICLGCVVQLTNGEQARVCTDGPVFDIGEVVL